MSLTLETPAVAKSQNADVEVKVDPPYYSSALTSYQNGDLRAAIHLFKLHLIDDPKHAESLYNIGVAYVDLEEYPNAIEYYEKCLKVDEENLNCNLNLGVLLVQLGRVREGKRKLQRVAELDPLRPGNLKEYINSLSLQLEFDV